MTGKRPARRGTTVVAVIALLLSLAGWGWFATEAARTGWWTFGEHVAVGPEEQGWASIDTLSVRLTSAGRAVGLEEEPPAGYVFLALDLQVESTETELFRMCDVEVRDAQGRLFRAGREVPSTDPYESSLTCGTSDPEEDPVPTTASMLVLVPVDAELTSLRVVSREFPPARFIELPLPS
ncbi:hypothetical protein [Ornithinimicrobium cavernae]|uniref:hypothetical protein n=1 Tax=Ornithinimicrobium cavernae TaxID=2666047 RepID=UPI000D6981E1|nr:hypothetical protein [Ornithinimicrobium cavernae]